MIVCEWSLWVEREMKKLTEILKTKLARITKIPRL